jgi:hypothetical protein
MSLDALRVLGVALAAAVAVSGALARGARAPAAPRASLARAALPVASAHMHMPICERAARAARARAWFGPS